MKNPLRYQISEYDCGPTSMLNAISYLFEREEIPPELIRNIMLYSLDCYGEGGRPGKSGTSRSAMMFLCHWLQGFGETGFLNVSGRYLSGSQVYIGEGSLINDALRRGGAAVVRLYYDVEHYVLMTGEEGERIQLFDPYYQKDWTPEPDIVPVEDHPDSYNRTAPFSLFNRETEQVYALGRKENREAVLLFNWKTELTPERTIEYFI